VTSLKVTVCGMFTWRKNLCCSRKGYICPKTILDWMNQCFDSQSFYPPMLKQNVSIEPPPSAVIVNSFSNLSSSCHVMHIRFIPQLDTCMQVQCCDAYIFMLNFWMHESCWSIWIISFLSLMLSSQIVYSALSEYTVGHNWAESKMKKY
jgi:hypothetical protein